MKKILGGYSGSILVIDLTNRTSKKMPLDTDLLKSYIGGYGINARLIYEFIEPGIDPLSPDNVLIFGAGPLVGTMVPAAPRTSLMSKSPLTGLLGISNAGHMGATLKFAGYDHLVIKGRAQEPVYIKIEDEKVEFASASNLWGKDTFETTDHLWHDLGEEYFVSCIGPAGENLVRFANILCNKGVATFGRTGFGAVMGSKNLKAITIYGTHGIKVSNQGKFMRMVNSLLESIMSEEGVVQEWRSLGSLRHQPFSIKKFGRRPRRLDIEAMPETYYHNFSRRFLKHPIACIACPVGCKAWLEMKMGRHPDLEFAVGCVGGQANCPFGLGLSVKQFDDVYKLGELANRYGIDSINTGAVLQLVIELYEDGVIGKADTDGLELRWGDYETIKELLRKIVQREGFGDILADGVRRICERIGKGSESYATDIKGMASLSEHNIDLRAVITPETFGPIVNPRGRHIDSYRFPPTLGQYEGAELDGIGRIPMDYIKKYADHIGVPKDRIEDVLIPKEYDEHRTFFNVPLMTVYMERYNAVTYSLGICDRFFICKHMDIKILANLYSYLTGIMVSPKGLLVSGERIFNVIRMFNVREGATRKDDRIPRRYLEKPLIGYERTFPHFKADVLNDLLDEYYQFHGWEKETGRPTQEKLKELGLEL